MNKAARLFVGTGADGRRPGEAWRSARFCLSHTLQLILKWFILEDQQLADALAACSFICASTRQSEYAREVVCCV